MDIPESAWQDLPGRSDREPGAALVHRLAGVLPSDVRVRAAALAPSGFDARFSAVWRRYAYRVSDAPGGSDPLLRRFVLAHNRTLDPAAMSAAGAGLLGEHDFAAFCRAREGATTIRTLRTLHCERDTAGLVVATVEADAFCHNQVRAMVGALLAVGDGRRPIDWPATVLAAGVRDPAVTVVAAHGLTLEKVGYPSERELASRASRARRLRSVPVVRDQAAQDRRGP